MFTNCECLFPCETFEAFGKVLKVELVFGGAAAAVSTAATTATGSMRVKIESLRRLRKLVNDV